VTARSLIHARCALITAKRDVDLSRNLIAGTDAPERDGFANLTTIASLLVYGEKPWSVRLVLAKDVIGIDTHDPFGAAQTTDSYAMSANPHNNAGDCLDPPAGQERAARGAKPDYAVTGFQMSPPNLAVNNRPSAAIAARPLCTCRPGGDR
jgi:hypothetical protein